MSLDWGVTCEMGFGQLVIGAPGSGKTTYCHGISQVEHFTSTLWNGARGGLAAAHTRLPERGHACRPQHCSLHLYLSRIRNRADETIAPFLWPFFYGPFSSAGRLAISYSRARAFSLLALSPAPHPLALPPAPHARNQYLTAAGRETVVVNLDPGNDMLPYDCAVDIMELIKLEDVMDEFALVRACVRACVRE